MAPLVALFRSLPPWLKQLVCGRLAPGHNYVMEMIRDEVDGFVLDPFTCCRHCGLPLPDSVLQTLIVRIVEDDYDEESA